MSDLSEQLRALPGFPPELPVLEPADLPEDPHELFGAWLREAIASGARQPHAMTFTTLDHEGFPVGRTLILKELDEQGFHLSTHAGSRKGLQLAADPRASMIFFWRESGRQVRVTGRVQALDARTSQADWQARPSYTGSPNPDWQVYALDPARIEFLQAREDRQHTRIEYRREGGRWRHEPVLTPAG